MRASLASTLGLYATVTATVSASSNSSLCKCLPSDSCWPLDEAWDSLNATVGGNLIKTVPLARTCHDPNFNNGTCSTLQAGWEDPTTQLVMLEESESTVEG